MTSTDMEWAKNCEPGSSSPWMWIQSNAGSKTCWALLSQSHAMLLRYRHTLLAVNKSMKEGTEI